MVATTASVFLMFRSEAVAKTVVWSTESCSSKDFAVNWYPMVCSILHPATQYKPAPHQLRSTASLSHNLPILSYSVWKKSVQSPSVPPCKLQGECCSNPYQSMQHSWFFWYSCFFFRPVRAQPILIVYCNGQKNTTRFLQILQKVYVKSETWKLNVKITNGLHF